uniref:Uncharacterized protein n=1 Tax=Knipowitschia caucasica TaxID=637954 RepID=A0AAV2KM67_KNICA
MSDAEESTGTAFAVSMAANIPPPSVMGFTGDWSTNWDVFRAEYEDYVLVTGVAEKDKKIQAATLRSVMGSECRHVYRHNLNLTAEQREDPAAILSALESTTGKVLCMDGEAESGQSSEEETHLYMIESVSAVGQTKGKKWFVTLKFNSKSQRCQLDSGATCNIMTLKDKKKLSSKGKLRQSDTCERLGFIRFTIPEDALKVDTVVRAGHLTKDTVEVQEDLQQVNQADYLNVTGQRLEQIRRHTDNDEGLQALRYTVTTGWPDLKEQTSIPVTNKLLEPVVVTGVTEKLQYRRQLAKSFYDRSARVLPELEVGETVRMKPPPGDTSRIWRAGTCLGKVAPRSYLVDMDGSVYRRNRVDLRVAESGAALGFGDRSRPEEKKP